jgi:hypothetical protein
MMKASHTDARLSKINDIPLKALAAAIVPRSFPVERRDILARRALLNRICGEFDEMPGTALTLAQASRLFGLSSDVCERILKGLVNDGRLWRTADGRFRLRLVAA